MRYYDLRNYGAGGSPGMLEFGAGGMPGAARAVALGNFDGFHVGHAEIIRRLLESSRGMAAAGGISLSAGVWCFSALTRDYLDDAPAARLTAAEEKFRLFAAAGLDFAIMEDFGRVRHLSPGEFVEKILIGECGVRLAACGFNFRFGAGGAGDAELLRDLLARHGAGTVISPPVFRRGRVVSSTAARFYIENGEMDIARELLGRPFSINFPVLQGRKLGRSIGLPTINQDFPRNHIIPRRGIYACTCEVGGDIFIGVSNVGTRPTVTANDTDKPHINCETHIINYSGWLYGKNIRVNFYRRLRDEMKFPSLNDLHAAINRDITAAKDYFHGC